jgi:hypothetical protein
MNTLFNQTNTRSASSSDDAFDEFSFNRSLLGHLKTDLLRKLSLEFSDVESLLVNQALNEAQFLAAQTTAPLLVLPVLAEEKVQALRKWSPQQRVLLQRRALAFAV